MLKHETKKISELIPNAVTSLERIISDQDARDQKVKADLQQAEKNYLKGKKQAYGIATQYKPQLQRCAFKLIVYWKVKKDGTPYAQHEIDSYANLKKIPSIDFDVHKRLNHEAAFNDLCDKVYKQADRMNKAIIVWCDYFNSEEHWIASFNCQNLQRSQMLTLHFKPKDEYGHIRFDYYEGEPIRKSQMRFYEGK